ncbi:MAG: hypothetical protein HY073_02285 [Deltaproteobacteria bacterium]|nr:hypothetical protein [Deltaproteobacteria bacterium]
MTFLILSFLVGGVAEGVAEAREPSIHEVQEETIRHLGFDQNETEKWEKQSRWSAALPRLQVGFQRDLKDVVSLTTKDSVSVTGGDVTVGPTQSNFDKNFNQGTSFDVRTVWYLNELVFNRDTLAASSERRDWMREKNRNLQEVTQAYFTRQRLVKELKKRQDPRAIREQKKLMLDQVTATIDAHTGGWFSQEMIQ